MRTFYGAWWRGVYANGASRTSTTAREIRPVGRRGAVDLVHQRAHDVSAYGRRLAAVDERRALSRTLVASSSVTLGRVSRSYTKISAPWCQSGGRGRRLPRSRVYLRAQGCPQPT